MCLVWWILLAHAWLAHASAVGYGMDGIELGSNYIPCESDVTGTGHSHSACCNAAAHEQKLAERANGGNPFGTFTIPTTTNGPATTTPLTTPTTTSQPTATTPTTGGTAATTSTSRLSTSAQSTAPTSSASRDADAESPGSDTSREALIAGLSVVSAIAAVCLLALVAALVYIRRLSHRISSTAAAPATSNNRPHSVGDPYETMTVHNATPAIRTSMISDNIPQAHELSPIREQSESSVGGRVSGGGASGILGSRSSAEVFDGFGEDIDWGVVNGGIVIAELPESSTPRSK